MGYRTAEEALADDQRVLGVEYGAAYYHCRQEFWRISANWDRYETLFGSRERVEILNSSSGHFWFVMQSMLFEHVLLGICRLTDPHRSGGRTNLSLDALVSLDPTSQKQALAHRITRARKFSEFARSWRNKRIGHNDFDQLTGAANLLAPATRTKVSKALVAMHDVLRWVQGRYFDGDLTLIDIGDGDASQLLVALAAGRELRKMEAEELAAGNYTGLLSRKDRYPSSDYGRAQRYTQTKHLPQPKPYRGAIPLK